MMKIEDAIVVLVARDLEQGGVPTREDLIAALRSGRPIPATVAAFAADEIEGIVTRPSGRPRLDPVERATNGVLCHLRYERHLAGYQRLRRMLERRGLDLPAAPHELAMERVAKSFGKSVTWVRDMMRAHRRGQ